MSYHLYQTRGFILKSADTGEANKVFFIFTEKLGLISASAQSVRKISSKLRYALRDLSFARLSLIRGKTTWRLTDAEELVSFSLDTETEKIKVFAGILSLVFRLVLGEGEDPELFSILFDSLSFLKNAELSLEEIKGAETLIVLKILSSLGYVGENQNLALFIAAPLSKEVLNSFEPNRREALAEINRALEESQL